jgi:hypothetical protein
VVATSPMVWWKIEMSNVELRCKPPFIDLVFTRVNVISSTVFVLEPVVKPATNNRNPIRKNHHLTLWPRRTGPLGIVGLLFLEHVKLRDFGLTFSIYVSH